MPITTLPPAPSRAVPATFSALADTFLGALPVFSTEANALLANVNSKESEYIAAANSAASAASSANFKGAWSSLTGAANIPYCVSHLGRYWQLLSNLANVAAKTPGTDSEWLEVGNVTQTEFRAANNPKSFSQGVNMTYALTGGSITIPNNDNLNFGTGNFTLVFKGSLPDWTSVVNIISKGTIGTDGFALRVDAAGALACRLAATTYTSSVANGLIDGTVAEVVAVVTVGAVNTTIDFYVNGVLLGAQQTAANPGSVSAVASLFINSSYAGATRFAGTVHHAYTFNRALTAAEVLDLYRNGISFADKYGSQTERMPNTVDRDFSGASAWANVDINAYNETDDLTITASAAAQYCTLLVASAPMVYGKKYKLTFDVANLVSTWTIKDFAGTITIGTVSASGAQSMEFENTGAAVTGGFRIIAVGTTSSGDFDNFSLKQIGATLALEPEGIQPNPGQWHDSSSNKLHALQPVAGSSPTRRMKTFEIRGVNTWAGTHEAQSMTQTTDASRAILPAGCYIDEIIGVVAGTTPHDIIIGDGSGTDRWVAITTGLAAGTVAFTIVNRISDGTNYELVIDPDTNATMTITWTVRGHILD